MSSSNVRSIDSLAAFHGGLTKLSTDWDNVLQELRLHIQRIDSHFTQQRPAYWRHQVRVAQRELGEAREALSQKRAAVRPGDRPPATEAGKRVAVAQRRLRYCQQKEKISHGVATRIAQQCDAILGPLAEVTEHCEVGLPRAATELATLIQQLRAYTDQSAPPAARPSSPDGQSSDQR